MDNRKFYTCCFTGHRPNKLPWGYNEKGIRFFLFKNRLRKAIKESIKNGYNYFISGMALGSDMLCAEIVLNLKKKHPNIMLECAIPCINQTERWLKDSVDRYNTIMSKADKVTYVSNKPYFNGCMQIRNKYMIDNSSLLIAVYNGSSGGTKQTIELAQKNQMKIKLISTKFA